MRALLVSLLLVCPAAMWAADSISITLGSSNVEQGLVMVGDRPGGDGLTVAGVEAGRPCRMNATRAAGGMMLYFQVDDAFLAPPGPHDCYVRVEYLDRGDDEWYLEYDSTDAQVLKVRELPGAFKTAGFAVKTGSGEWRYVDFHLPDARFAGRCNGADFRLNVGNPEDGPDCFAAVTVYRQRPAEYRPPEEAVKMRTTTAGPGMEVIFGATNFEPKAPATHIGAFFKELRLDWFSPLGARSWESYVRWSALEPEPGKWDFSVYDEEVRLLEGAGLRWVPFFILGPNYATPEWFKSGPQSVFARCLEHGTDSAVQSIWNPTLPAQVDRVLGAFGRHYAGRPVLESLLLGISGDFGEAIYPVSGGGWTGDYHQHGGYWCGDPYARASFQRYLAAKYADVTGLNAAWGTDYAALAAAEYPPVGEGGRPGVDVRTPQGRRRWLDFIDWYRQSMNEWVALWMGLARRHFPQAEIYLCTGGDGHPTHGSDFTAQCKAAAAVGGGVRITNEASDYTANLMLTRWVGTASRFYGGYFTYEPAGAVDERGIVARIYNVAASGARGLFEYSGNVTSSGSRRRSFQGSIGQLTAGEPVVDVAFLVPNTYLALHPDEYWSTFFDRPRRFRDQLDFDLVDEGLIADGALSRYRVAVWVGGDLLPAETAGRLREWVRAGGILLAADTGRMTTVEGRLITWWPYRATGRELTKCARPLGKGMVVFYPGAFDEARFAGMLVDLVYDAGQLGPGFRSAPRVDGRKDGVFTTLRTGDVILYNATAEPVEVDLAALGGTVKVGGHSIATVRRPR